MAEHFELTAEMKAHIGKDSPPWTFEINTTSIRAFARGVGYTDPVYYDIEAAKKSELVIMAVGESEIHNGEAHSRTDIGLPGVQLQLLKEIQKTGKPIAMVLFTGRPLTINWELENIPAILLAWHPGIEGGNGITDVLFGDYNPA